MKAQHYIAAEEYRNAPLVDPAALYSWSALARDVGRLYPYVLKQGVVMEVQPEWRYLSYDMICKDVQQGRIVRAMDFYPHPVWDLETQSLFRVVHDWFHFECKLDITIEGELEIVQRHHRITFSEASYPAIVAEIYGQAAYSLVYGEFGPNKVFIPSLAQLEHHRSMKRQQATWDFTDREANRVLDVGQWGRKEVSTCSSGVCHI